MDRDSLIRRASTLKSGRQLKWKRLFIEAQNALDAARWVEIALTDQFLNLFEHLHRVLVTEKLAAVESRVLRSLVKWAPGENWEIERWTTVRVDDHMALFEAYAYPEGLTAPLFVTRHAVTAVLFYGNADEFVQSSRHDKEGVPHDEIHVNPEEYGLDRKMYRPSTIQSMIADQEDDFISVVNTYLINTGQPVLRLPKIP